MKHPLYLLLALLWIACSPQTEPKTELELGREAMERLQTVVIPSLSFENTDSHQALEFIASQVRKKYPDFEYLILDEPTATKRTISLNIRNIPAWDALRAITTLGEYHLFFSGPVLKITNSLGCGEDITYRAYRFPKKILIDDEKGQGEFVDVKPLFTKMGLKFPEGTEAVYRQSREILIVRNTVSQLDLIGQIVGTQEAPRR